MIAYQSKHTFHIAMRLFCLSLAVGLCGCQFAPSTPKMRWPWAKEKPAVHPERVVAVWTDTVLHQPNQPGVRGFGGRVYFYEKDKTDPIEVEGGLAVYVFDAEKLEVHDQRPERKFVFTPEQFASQMSRTSLGPSYSVWLPWGEVGGPPKRLSLIARYEGSAGGTTIGEPTIKLLPGVPNRSVDSATELADKNKKSPYQLVGHTEAQRGDGDNAENSAVQTLSGSKRSRHDVKTIDLPPSFQRHLQQPGEGESLDSLAPTPSNSSGGGTSASSGISANSSTSANSGLPAAQPASDGSSEVITLDNDALQQLSEAQATAPMTTKVIDHRSRTQQRFGGNGVANGGTSGTSSPSRLDIREGRWLEGKPRIGPVE